jgi:ATP-dependent helicase/nuclease subunit A
VILRDHDWNPFEVTMWGTQDGCPVPLPEVLAATGLRDASAYVCPLPPPNPQVREEVKRRLEWQYPYLEMTRTRAKMSVGELKRNLETQDEEDAWRYLPKPERRMGLDDSKGYNRGILRGIAVHTVLSKIDLAKAGSLHGVLSEVTRLTDLGFLDASHLREDDTALIAALFQTSLGMALVTSPERVHREVPFTMKMPADLAATTRGAPGDQILVQGVIDAILEDDDGVSILDYKTDDITPAGVPNLADRYIPQLSLYALAVQKILRRPVKNVWIAFLTAGQVLEVDWRGYLESRLDVCR